MSGSEDVLGMLEDACSKVRDPVSGKSVLLAGLVQRPVFEGGRLRFDLAFADAHAKDDRRAIEEAIVANLRGLGFEGEVFPFARAPGHAPPPPTAHKRPPVPGMEVRGGVAPHGGPIVKKQLDGVKHIICVASGKGGVGKSTVATNLAVALQREGAKVGLMDADVYGPSVHQMMNVHAQPMLDDRQFIIPVSSYGVKCLSMGLLVPEEQAVIWRGPMIMNMLRQMLQQAAWGPLDVLVIDLPPGTGDAQLTLIQAVDLDGAVIVTTPQPIALADAVRGISMFEKLEVPLLGLVENMAWYELPDGERDYIFGEGGGARLASQKGIELLGQVPLRTAVRRAGDQGLPAALGEDATASSFRGIARRVLEQLAARSA